MKTRSPQLCIAFIVIVALVTVSGCARHALTEQEKSSYSDSYVRRETILKLTEEWSKVPRDPKNTIYHLKNGIGLPSPATPRFQGPNGPDDIHWLSIYGEAKSEGLGRWYLSMGMTAEPEGKSADAYPVYPGDVIQCGEWVIRIRNVVDDGGSFVILAHPDLPPAKY